MDPSPATSSSDQSVTEAPASSLPSPIIPSSLIFLINNVKNIIAQPLTTDNHPLWRSQFITSMAIVRGERRQVSATTSGELIYQGVGREATTEWQFSTSFSPIIGRIACELQYFLSNWYQSLILGPSAAGILKFQRYFSQPKDLFISKEELWPEGKLKSWKGKTDFEEKFSDFQNQFKTIYEKMDGRFAALEDLMKKMLEDKQKPATSETPAAMEGEEIRTHLGGGKIRKWRSSREMMECLL
ncbi:hypothetical protein M5K25_010567 [Dendrobium thyrsiflorum]|uniref:Uncharacterized protein n=1 Tax=Dendrobium thyrsiflorum TaxID=117978 RepID=A0ABD0V7W3_DENTH